MSASPAGRRGLRGFRLSEVPEGVRLSAYEKLMKLYEATGLGQFDVGAVSEIADLGMAAAAPSERVYWIPRAVWEAESRKRAWK